MCCVINFCPRLESHHRRPGALRKCGQHHEGSDAAQGENAKHSRCRNWGAASAHSPSFHQSCDTENRLGKFLSTSAFGIIGSARASAALSGSISSHKSAARVLLHRCETQRGSSLQIDTSRQHNWRSTCRNQGKLCSLALLISTPNASPPQDHTPPLGSVLPVGCWFAEMMQPAKDRVSDLAAESP